MNYKDNRALYGDETIAETYPTFPMISPNPPIDCVAQYCHCKFVSFILKIYVVPSYKPLSSGKLIRRKYRLHTSNSKLVVTP